MSQIKKFKKVPCIKCGANLSWYFLKNGMCNACINPHLVVPSVGPITTFEIIKNSVKYSVKVSNQNNDSFYLNHPDSEFETESEAKHAILLYLRSL